MSIVFVSCKCYIIVVRTHVGLVRHLLQKAVQMLQMDLFLNESKLGCFVQYGKRSLKFNLHFELKKYIKKLSHNKNADL